MLPLLVTLVTATHAALVPQAALDLRRNLHYLGRAGYVFASYKAFQLKTKVAKTIVKPDRETVDEWWSAQHDWGGRQMYGLACDLEGFHLKGLQWLGSRPDIAPKEFVRHLSKLQDQCPPLALSRGSRPTWAPW